MAHKLSGKNNKTCLRKCAITAQDVGGLSRKFENFCAITASTVLAVIAQNSNLKYRKNTVTLSENCKLKRKL